MDPVDQDLNKYEADQDAYSKSLSGRISYHIDDITQDSVMTREFLSERLANLEGMEFEHLHNLFQTDRAELGRFIQSLYAEWVRDIAQNRATLEVV